MKVKKLFCILLTACMSMATCTSPIFGKISALDLSQVELYSDYDFFEDFDSSETIDTTIWHHQVVASVVMNVAKDPESTDAQYGKGYSFYTDGVNKSFIEHTFNDLIRGKVSVDFYDDGTNSTGRMAQFNLTGIANTANSNKPFTIGLGINQNTATSGYSLTNYSARIADDGRYFDTGIARTKGWHTFSIEVNEEGARLWIDGVEIDTNTVPEKDVITAFQNIQIGDKWGKGGNTYFDNVRLENMTVVDLESEEAAKQDATLKNIQIDEFSISNFEADKLDYKWEVANDEELPLVTAQATNEKAKVEVVQANEETKKAIITVIAADGKTTKTYTVSFVDVEEIDAEWGTSFEEDEPMSLWETLDSRGTYTEISTDQAHEGEQSFITKGTSTTKSWIFKKFDTPVTGKISVWFYDTKGATGTESFQQVNVWTPFEDVTEQPTISGISTQKGYSYYYIRTPGNGYQATSIVRTVGWHEFVLDVTSGVGATYYIDGKQVYTTTAVTSIGALQMGDIWSTSGATAYYDDVKITNIQKAVSGIMLNKEVVTLQGEETVQLVSKVLPVGTTSDVTWSSSNENVATVDQNGLVTAKAVGTTTITAKTSKGNFIATCEVNVTKAADQDASLKAIQIDGEELENFAFDQFEYKMTIVNQKVPTVTAQATQTKASVRIIDAEEIPGTATIEVIAPDGVTKQVYTIQFEKLENIFFDDFSYINTEDLEKNGNWDVQEGTGRRPGNRNWYWSADNVVLMQDPEDPANTIVRLKATTDGSGGENTTQSQIRYYEEKFGAGVYVAKVWLYDNVMEADGEEGSAAWNAKDQALSTFFTINRIEAPSWEPYHESDFEYLFNGGWGGAAKTMWFTTWNSYALATSTEGQTNQVTTNNSQTKSLDGKWTILTIKIDEDGRTTYYIDGEQKASHANKDNCVGPQSIAFNLWFINATQQTGIGSRTYWEDIDWIYYSPDTSVTTSEVEKVVEDMKEANIQAFDEINSPDITLNAITVNGSVLEGFDNETTEYTITLPKGTTEIPVIEATANSQWAIVDITDAKELPGTTTVYVTSSDLSVTRTYHINFIVENDTSILAPLSNFASGSSVKYRDVKLFHPDDNAQIYYTVDGSLPTIESTKYQGETIRIEESTNIKAIAVVNGKVSTVADFLYTVIPMTPQVSPHPVANLSTGTYEGTQYLELSIPESLQRFYEVPGRVDNYKIYYTTDGTLPTVNQYKPNSSTKLYTGPIEISETTTINYIAVFPGVCESYESTEANRNKYSRVTITIVPIPEYTITIDEMIHGSVVADKLIAKENDTVQLTIIPDEGYTLKEGSLKINGIAIETTSFTMPKENVVITAEFTDVTNPLISGVEDGNHYCDEQVITVTDVNLESVTIDGEKVTLNDAGTYLLGEGTHTVVAIDTYGNTTTISVSIGHIVVVDKAVDPTCEEKGLTEGKHCSKCGEVLLEQEEIPALGHDYKDGVCQRCGAKDPNYKEKDDSVNTSDNMNIVMWTILCTISMVFIIIINHKKIKKLD